MSATRRKRWKQRILRYRKAVQGYTLYIMMVALFLCFLPIIAISFWGKNQYFLMLVIATFIFTVFALLYLSFTKREIIDKGSWFMLILFVPFFGAFLFWFVGISQTRPKIYWKKSQRDSHLTKKVQEGYGVDLPDDLKAMQSIAPASQFTMGNKQQFLTGQDVYDAMMKDMRKAKHHIHVEMYIVRYDKTTKALFDIMVAQAQAGVEVRLLLDVFGTVMFRDKMFEALIDAGIDIVFFNQQTRQFLDHSHVNHRKTLIIDGEIAYTGGFNFGDEYVNGYPDKKLKWFDTMTRITGNLVESIQLMYLLDWSFSLGEDIDDFSNDKNYFPQSIQHVGGEGPITQFLIDGPDREGTVIKDTFSKLMHDAKERIYLTTPYLIPPDDTLNDLKLAALSGVDVRIVIPDVPDKRIVYHATESHIEDLLKVGVRVYKMKGYFVHSKLYVFDDRTTMYGTANVDMRSFFLNFEANVVQYHDAKFNKAAMKIFDDIFKRSKELKYPQWKERSWMQKILEKTVVILNPLF